MAYCPPIADYDLYGDARNKLRRLVALVERGSLSDREVEQRVRDLKSWLFEPQCTFFMRDFKRHNSIGDEWFSEPFYTHAQGYKMCLGVYANGYKYARGRYLSVVVHIMRGEFDDRLKWPFRGTVNFQMLDQSNKRGHQRQHLSGKVVFDGKTPASGKVPVVASRNEGLGILEFAPLSGGGYGGGGYGGGGYGGGGYGGGRYGGGGYGPEYLKQDKLCFEVTVVAQ